jgi:CRP-like cAMP-binding protein
MAGHSTLSLMERVLFLRQVPLFADLAPSDLKQVAAVAAEEVFGDSEVLATQGEPGDELFVIVSGSVQVLASGRAGQPVELARVDSGSYVGEMAILTGEPCMASLVAVGSLRVLTIGQKQFESILRDRPETSLAVIRVLCARLRDAEVGTNRNVDRNDGGAL